VKGLTKRQKEILDFLQSYLEKHRYSPSYREIMKKFGFSSLASVYKHLHILKRKGYVDAEKRCSRSLSLNPLEKETLKVDIPFIGQLSAHGPIETFPQAQTLSLPSYLIRNPAHSYVLRVVGDAFTEELIGTGDLVVVETGRSAEEGDCILALINHDNMLIKRYHAEGSYIRLESYNVELHPIIVREADLVILGMVVGLLRMYH
jgi:repressor LexA